MLETEGLSQQPQPQHGHRRAAEDQRTIVSLRFQRNLSSASPTKWSSPTLGALASSGPDERVRRSRAGTSGKGSNSLEWLWKLHE